MRCNWLVCLANRTQASCRFQQSTDDHFALMRLENMEHHSADGGQGLALLDNVDRCYQVFRVGGGGWAVSGRGGSVDTV